MRRRRSGSPNAARVRLWQSSKLPDTAYARTFVRSPLNIVSCASCVGLTRPSGYRITTRVFGTR